MSEVIALVAARFGVSATLLPVSDDRIETRIDALDALTGEQLDLHFQQYWVQRRAADAVKAVRYIGASESRPAPRVLESIAGADAVVICPSNPVVSIGPILAVPGVREAVAARHNVVAGVSPIVEGKPVAGMADKLMPAAGLEVSAAGVAAAYADLLEAWVIDDRDAALAPRIERMGVRVEVTDTIMTDDDAAERLARRALNMISG
jgi:LPPG:FO 2-phospho-L-lactate transferase